MSREPNDADDQLKRAFERVENELGTVFPPTTWAQWLRETVPVARYYVILLIVVQVVVLSALIRQL